MMPQLARFIPATMKSSPRRPVFGAVVTAVVGVLPLVGGPFTANAIARLLPLALVAASVALLTGVCGLPTLGQLAPYLAGGYVTAALIRGSVQIGVVHLLAAAVAGAVVNLLGGLLIIRTRATVCLMLTLALGQLAVTAAGQLTVLGGTDGMLVNAAVRPLPGMPILDDDNKVYLYVAVVTAAVLAILWRVVRATPGMLLAGCRDNEARMRASGHHVGRYLLWACTGAGAVAGIAAALTVTVQQYLSPADGGYDIATLILLAVVIAGARSILLCVPAVILVFAVRDYGPQLFGASDTVAGPAHTPLYLGAALIAAVYLLPGGLAAVPARVRGRLSRHCPASTARPAATVPAAGELPTPVRQP